METWVHSIPVCTMNQSHRASLNCTELKWIESDWTKGTEEHVDWDLFNDLILFTASRYPTSESGFTPRLRLSTKSSPPPPPILWSMMTHRKDVDVSVLNEQVGTAQCQLQRKPFVLQRPIRLVNETVVQTRTARPYGKDAAALVLLRWEER